MVAKLISDFLRMVGPQPIYFEGDNIWISRSSTHRPRLQRVSSLSGLLTSELKQITQNRQPTKALQDIASIYDFEFCLCQLIPYLRFLNSGHPEDLVCSPELQKSISSLSQQANALEVRIRQHPTHEITASQFHCLLGIPCVVFAGVVIPIHRVISSDRPNVTINGACYQYDSHKVRQLRLVLLEIDRTLETIMADSNPVPLEDSNTASKYLECAESILSYFCQPVKSGVYQVVYKDHKYEFQYSSGKFMLVVGPLQNRINQQNLVYVGMPIAGICRADRIRSTLLRATTPQGFWTGAGLPINPNICLGSPHQYSRLSISDKTNVEAVLNWLDVGVNIATGRTAFHQQWRSMRNGLHLRRQLTRG